MVFTTKEERKDFILNKQYLVFAIIKRTNIFFMNAILQVDDLVSHGTIGLIDAVDKYDPEKGAFNQYARRRILGEIFEGMRSTDHLKRTARKKVKNGQVIETLDREQLWEVYTPQTFIFDQIMEAHRKAEEKNITVRDDAELIELIGLPVHVLKGTSLNIKITDPFDLILAKLLIKEI